MTFRGYHARLIAITQNRLRDQREMALSVLIGIAGAFSGKKGEGLDGIMKSLDKHIGDLDDAMIEVLGGRQSATDVIEGLTGGREVSAGEHQAVAATVLQQARVTRAARTVADVQKDIRSLDVIMSNLTGSVVRNPSAGWNQGQGPSMYSLGRQSVTDQLGRV